MLVTLGLEPTYEGLKLGEIAGTAIKHAGFGAYLRGIETSSGF